MSRLTRAAGVSAIFTLFGACFYFGFGVLWTVAQGGNAAQFFVDALLGSLVLWVVLTFVLEPIMGAFDDANKRGRDDQSAAHPHTGEADIAPPQQEKSNE